MPPPPRSPLNKIRRRTTPPRQIRYPSPARWPRQKWRGFFMRRWHGNRILVLDETEEDSFEGIGREAGSVSFASDTIF